MDELINNFKLLGVKNSGGIPIPFKSYKLPHHVLPREGIWLLIIKVDTKKLGILTWLNVRIEHVIIDHETAYAFVNKDGICAMSSLPNEFGSSESFMKILFPGV